MSDIDGMQRETCARYGTGWVAAPRHQMVGVALNVKLPVVPVNGLRHPPIGDSTGWFIWAGEGDPSAEPDFFVPLHVEHLEQWRPEVLRFLGLPPGWRFLTDGAHEDVWEDPGLLNV